MKRLALALVLGVAACGGPSETEVATAKTAQYTAPDDPNLPGFVKGRTDTLAFAIYDAAKPHVAR